MARLAQDSEPYWKRLPRLRKAVGLSQTQLFRHVEGLGFEMIKAFEIEPKPAEEGKRPRWRYPTPEAFEKLSAALGVPPEEFPEYRLAKAREALDERIRGLEDALENLEAHEPTRRELDEASLQRFRDRARGRVPRPDEDRRQPPADRRTRDARGGRP